MKVIEKGADVGLKALHSIGVINFIQLPLTGLMYKPQLILPIEKTSKRVHNCAVDRLRALASSKDEDGIRSHVRLRRNGFEFRANRIAGDDPTVAEIRLRARIGDGSKVDPFAERAVGESGNRILFHDDARIRAKNRRAEHRKRCIPANTDHCIRLVLPKNLPGFENGGDDTAQIPNLPRGADALDASYGQCLQVESFLRDDPCFNSLLGSDKQYRRGGIAPLDFSGHGNARKQMPSGPAARYDHPHESQIRTKLTRLLRHI